MKSSGIYEIFQGSLHLHLKKKYQQLEYMRDHVYKTQH